MNYGYKHGAYGIVEANGTKLAAKSGSAFVYVGTAPVHTIKGGKANVNKPVLINNMAEARKLFGYSDDWAKYTLCEAMYAHLQLAGVGPLVLINVLDPETHKAAESGTVTLTPENGQVKIVNAGDIILDSVAVTGKTLDTDYTINYNIDRQIITLTEMKSGGLGNEQLTITYNSVDASKVTGETVIGSTDGMGLNKGLYAIKNVYQATGYNPAYLLSPGFSTDPEVHKEMLRCANKVNKHWDVIVYADIPIVDGEGGAVTLLTVSGWKTAHGYNAENEKVFFPMAKGTDGKKYHLSVLGAANLEKLLVQQDGVPYKSCSNTACPIIQNLYLGEEYEGRVYDDSMINEMLNQYGITSAAYVGGRWAIWGSSAAAYGPDDDSGVNVFDTNMAMLYYVCNDFQKRRSIDVDKPVTLNDLQTIAAEENARLEALMKIGALTSGEVYINADAIEYSDVVNGDYAFAFKVSTTPLAKSLTAYVGWDEEGYVIFYNSLRGE